MKLKYISLFLIILSGPIFLYKAMNAKDKITMKLESSAFKNNEMIPEKYTADGENVSPQLSWTGFPPHTKSFVLIVDDPDAPSAKAPGGKPWVHWVVFDIPEHVHKLDMDAAVESLDAKQGLNSNNEKKYFGPKPPPGSGVHHYNFKIYALAKILGLHAGVTKQEITEAMKHHILAQGELIGTYQAK